MSSHAGVSEKEGLAYGFKVSISSSDSKAGGSKDTMYFNSCEGIQSEIEVQFLNDGSASDRAIPVRGRKLGGIITFSRGVAKTGNAATDFFKWYQKVCDSSEPLKKGRLKISLVHPSHPEKDLASWEVSGAWPCRWSGPFLETQMTSPTVERISFAYESIVKV